MSPLEIAFASYSEKRPTAFVVKVKKNKNGELDELFQLTSFLEEPYNFPPVIQRIKHYASKDFFIRECPICKRPLAFREKPNPDYLKTCGSDECHRKQNYLATKESLLKTHGVENISQTKEWRDKVKATNMERHGVEWNTQSQSLIEAAKKTWENCDEKIAKRKETNLKRYGAEHANQNADVKKRLKDSMTSSYKFQVERILKAKKTNVENYGGWYCASSECQDKKYQRKAYVFPSGRLEMVQGYEPKAIDEILAAGIHEDDIVVGNVKIEKHIGKITYVDTDNKEHQYFPDIYVISENKVIEVKSEYTLSRDFWINSKRNAILNSGIAYELKIY
jgi:hypothetical protein